MKKIRLFIVDEDLPYIESVAEYMSTMRDIEVVGYASDGYEAGRQIVREQPDCILTGLILRRVNGFSLLRMVHGGCSHCAIIVCSFFANTISINMANRIGIDLFLAKPITLAHLHESIVATVHTKRRMEEEKRQISGEMPVASMTAEVHRALIASGISPRMHGFSCLAEGLYQLLGDQRLLRNLRRNLYPRIAEALSTTPENVERNIRTAIHHSRKNMEDLAPPTNRQFLARLLGEISEGRL